MAPVGQHRCRASKAYDHMLPGASEMLTWSVGRSCSAEVLALAHMQILLCPPSMQRSLGVRPSVSALAGNSLDHRIPVSLPLYVRHFVQCLYFIITVEKWK